MKAFALLAILPVLLVTTVLAARPGENTLTLTNTPTYNEDAVFLVQMERKYNGDLKLATWCSDADSYTGAESAPLPKWKGKTYTGIISRTMAHPTWQPPMLCCTCLFHEPNSAKRPDVCVTNSECFTVQP
jgi:hypothetical protein